MGKSKDGGGEGRGGEGRGGEGRGGEGRGGEGGTEVKGQVAPLVDNRVIGSAT